MGKRLLTLIGMVLGVCFSAPVVYGSIDNLSNLSAEWMRTGARNAATDSADVVFYNPAGLTKLSKGLHLNISNQSLDRKPEHSFIDMYGNQRHYEQDSPDPLLPNFYCSYNTDRWSIFGGAFIPGGGGTVDYPEGSVSTYLIGLQSVDTGNALSNALYGLDMFTGFENESLEGSSIYLGTTIGAAYKIADELSFAAGLRYIDVEKTTKANLTLIGIMDIYDTGMAVDIKDTASGFGGVLSFNFNATDKLNIAAQYQTGVELDFETEVTQDDTETFIDGEKNRRDLPPVFGFGMGYQFSDKLYGELDYTHWFQKQADWGTDESGHDIAKLAGDVWSIGATFAYKLTPGFLVSAGTSYTKYEWNDIDAYYSANLGACEVHYSDNLYIGAGFAWKFIGNTQFNLSIGYTMYDDETINFNGITVDSENNNTIIAAGIDIAY